MSENDPKENLNPEDNLAADALDDLFNGTPDSENMQESTDEVTQLRSELKEAQERILRSQAELENYRRRMRREVQEEKRYATQPLLTDLVPVVDNIERAIESAQQTSDSSSLLEGVRMVAEQLISVLEKHNCPRIAALGETFDPSVHQAIGQQPSDDYEPGKVMLVACHGYQLHDRVIRPSQVIVSQSNDA